MPIRSGSKSYINLNPQPQRNDTESSSAPWYWRLIALAASWMILGGYGIMPGLYWRDPELRFSQAILSVLVVALLTAGYSLTALLCFACRDEVFQAEAVFVPTITYSAFGLLMIAFNFLFSHRCEWKTAAITGTAVSTSAIVLYGILLFWTQKRIVKMREASQSRSGNLWSNESFYTNFIQNMYPSAARSTSTQRPEIPLSEDDRINQQMAMLLKKSDSGPSPDAASGTFRIDLPDDEEEQRRILNSSELVGTPPAAHADFNRTRTNSRPESLSEESAWQRWDRGRTQNRPSSIGARSNHSRGISREERRMEIEMGRV